MADSALSTEEQLTSIWKLGGLGFRQLAKNVYDEIDHDNVLGRASELAYNFLLAVFPLLLCIVALVGIFASVGSTLSSDLFAYLGQALPASASQVISKSIDEVTTTGNAGKLTFGIVFALWSAAGGMTSMMSALNGAYHIRESRSWVKTHLIAVGLTIAIALLIITALTLVLVGSHIANIAGSTLHLGAVAVVGWKVMQWIGALFFIILAFAIIYYYAPDVHEQHWYWITPGSVIGVLLWLATSVGFRVYLHFFNSYSKTYGSLGAVIILIVWFYITGLAFLIGGEINAAIEHAAAERGHSEAKEEGHKAA